MKEYLAMMGGTCSPTLGYDAGMKWLLSYLSSAERRRRAKSDRSRSSIVCFTGSVIFNASFVCCLRKKQPKPQIQFGETAK